MFICSNFMTAETVYCPTDLKMGMKCSHISAWTSVSHGLCLTALTQGRQSPNIYIIHTYVVYVVYTSYNIVYNISVTYTLMYSYIYVHNSMTSLSFWGFPLYNHCTLLRSSSLRLGELPWRLFTAKKKRWPFLGHLTWNLTVFYPSESNTLGAAFCSFKSRPVERNWAPGPHLRKWLSACLGDKCWPLQRGINRTMFKLKLKHYLNCCTWVERCDVSMCVVCK